MLTHSQQYSCPRCKAHVENEAASCWCFDLYCMSCYALAIFCKCKLPALRMQGCDNCDHSVALEGYDLDHLEMFGFQYGQDESDHIEEPPIQCVACEEGLMRQRFCFLEHRDICGHCHKVDRQEDILPCSSKSCLGDEEGMFHSSCMTAVGEDIFQCQTCLDAGAPIKSDGSSEEDRGEDEEAETDDEDIDQ
eukprot:gnl/MRDRNA2_/MRDRNA2_84255_c0_seq1.p1 gnl/MRDRNA2_/MRDRNA2_84255_c0~~gnl/MRDRNA2_/MRDRNA2_84255_c0_seq1.p1  ORF type:complete len:192 (-),score=31.32 gnl/MRDRNA2_/MRDRNA2_84255_c0_seq1:424-999(-)